MRETQILESQCRNQLGILCTVKVLPKIDQITSSWRKLKPENDILGTEMKTEILMQDATFQMETNLEWLNHNAIYMNYYQEWELNTEIGEWQSPSRHKVFDR